MSDEQLQAHFYDRDGPWSDVTKAAIKRFKVARLDLDSNWASTRRSWTCPGCAREKSQIFRVSNSGVLLARLDWHHDHLEDLLKQMLKAKFGDNWPDRVLPKTGRLQDRVCAMIARFEPGLVCIDCNNVDGRVKAKFKDMSPWFSFSPKEISTFISARHNSEHEIDFTGAYALHQSLSPNIEARKVLLNHIVQMIDSGDLDQETGPIPPNKADFLRRHILRGFYESGPQFELDEDVQAFQTRSLSRAGTASTKVAGHWSSIEPPTMDELTQYDGGGGGAGLWRAAPIDWQCPACGRNRAEILRRSKNPNRKWSGKLLRHTEYVIGDSWNDDAAGYDDDIDHEVTHIICSDCASIAPELKKRFADLSGGGFLLQLRDMKAVLTARANQPHDIDWALAVQRMRQSDYLRLLIHCYQRKRADAFNCRSLYIEALAESGGDRERAKSMIIDYWVQVTKLSREKAETEIRTLISRATYLAKADTGLSYKAIRNRIPAALENTTEAGTVEL